MSEMLQVSPVFKKSTLKKKENSEDGSSPAKKEIQSIVDLKAKLHTLRRLSRENFLTAQ